MVQAASAIRPGITSPKFLQPASNLVQGRLARANRLLDAGLTKTYLKNPGAAIRNWPQHISEIMLADFEMIDTIIEKIDQLPNGVVLDKADSLMRQLYLDLEKGILAPEFNLQSFAAIETSGDYDLGEFLVRSFGIVNTIIEAGKGMGLLPKHLEKIEERFERGYIMLRALELLSHRN